MFEDRTFVGRALSRRFFVQGASLCTFAAAAGWALPVLAAERKSGSALLKAFAKEAQGAEGRFRQTTKDRDGRLTAPASEGAFAFRRPGCFEWRYEKPYRQTIVSDGKTLWLYDEDLMQATEKPLAGALPASPATILFGAADLERDWTLEDLPADDGRPRVRARPKGNAAFESVDVTFDAKDLPCRVVFLDSFALSTDIELLSVALALPAPERFQFVPPKGGDVLRDESLL